MVSVTIQHEDCGLIRTFKSKALRKLFEDGDARGVPAGQVNRIDNRLATLNASRVADDMNIAGYASTS